MCFLIKVIKRFGLALWQMTQIDVTDVSLDPEKSKVSQNTLDSDANCKFHSLQDYLSLEIP